MTYRSSDSSCKSYYSQPQSRLNQQIKSASNDEGCPVLEESGSVCGETESLSVFLDFKKIYDDCLKKLERTADGKTTLRKLAPFQRLIDHLWEQNAMLIETVGELEEEATCRLSTLQEKLNKSCQKIDDYQEDINSLITIIHRFCEKGVLDPEGVEFKTLCPSYIYGPCENSCTECECMSHIHQPQTSSRSMSVNCNNCGTFDGNRESDDSNSFVTASRQLDSNISEKNSASLRSQLCCNEKISNSKSKSSHLNFNTEQNLKKKELHCTLRTKEREVESLSRQLSEKNDLISEYCDQIEHLKNETKNQCKKFKDVIKRLKSNRHDGTSACDGNTDENSCDSDNQNLEELLYVLVRNVEDQRKSVIFQLQSAECQLRAMASEKKVLLKERNEIANQLQCLKAENERLMNEIAEQKKEECGKEKLMKTIEALKLEKNELTEKINVLQENIQKLNTNFKETRWALTSEVAEKHDQVQELRKCVGLLEEQLRQADMQTHFKDDIIKELRKELKSLTKTESRGLFDVVNEVRERKNCKNPDISTTTVVSEGKKSASTKCKCPASQYPLATSSCDGNKTRSREFISVSESGFNRHYAQLSCITNKIEEILRCLSAKSSGSSNYKTVIEQEMEKLRVVKNELEKNKIKTAPSECSDKNYKSCSELFRSQETKCNLVHVEDVEKFREKAITGVAALEKMREQIGILENLIKKYLDNFPCKCDKLQVKQCEEKIEKFHSEFDEITGQLCSLLQNIRKPSTEQSVESFSSATRSISTNASLISDEVSKFKSERSKLEKEICEQENALEALKQRAENLEEEIRCKALQLADQTTEIDSRACEIMKTRALIQKVCQQMKEQQCNRTIVIRENIKPPSPKNMSDLDLLFCDLKELCSLLEKSAATANQKSLGISEKLIEENEKLKEKLNCLEKCVNNKDETLRVLQDTVRLKECQIEELKSKMESSENQSSKLTQDIEEKCHLISNLQEAIRKCKQFEAHKDRVETLQFELCDLDCTLKKYEKEIHRKSRIIENLHEQLTNLSSKNLNLTEKINIIEPKLKIVYKTCNLFEKMVTDLQGVIRCKEEEIEGLYGKIKELENELDSEFKKFEYRASEDSKCIEELNMRLKNFQNEYACTQESYNASLAVIEGRLKNEQEMSSLREKELNNTICQLQMELKTMEKQLLENSSVNKSSSRTNELQSLLNQAESRIEMYNIRIADLQKALECAALEREEERKSILEKLCEEKKENVKSKALITKLNENIKLKSLNEKILKERVDNFLEDKDNLVAENQELRTELEARKRIMSASEKDDGANLSELEKLICSLKIQKFELKSKCCNLRAEMDKEVKLRKTLECRVEDLNIMLQNKLDEFNCMVENYKCTTSRLQQTLCAIKEVENNFKCIESKMKENLDNSPDLDEFECLKKLLNIKTAENAKLICQLQVLQVEMESMQNENILVEANTEAVIANLRHEVNCLQNVNLEYQVKSRKLDEENKRLRRELDCLLEKEASMEIEFREKQKELCGKLKNTIYEKNDLLNSLDELQKQLEEICLDNINKEKINRDLSEECSRLKLQTDSNDLYMKSKSEKIICSLGKEVKSLHCELSTLRENYDVLDKEYKDLLNKYKFCEKKKCNLEKLYMEMSNENQELLNLKMKYERELCELNSQNLLLKDKLANTGDGFRNAEDKQILCEKLKELTIKIRSLEKRVIPDLEEEIAQKNCCIENLRVELREANISSQRIRSEAVRVIQCTKKYLAAQRCANESLKSRLECSNKRRNILGAENRELEEQLKAVTRMNEFLLSQLESNKSEIGETEPRSFSPLPWSCSTVERDTSSSEYLAESGFQSMQPSPTNMDIDCDSQNDFKRNSTQWNSSKKNKCGGSIDCSSYRNGMK